jgi:glutathione peroxidase
MHKPSISMPCWFLFCFMLGQSTLVTAQTTVKPLSSTCPPILQHQLPRLQDEQPQDLCQYSGKVILVVNTASYCGFTKQYQGLEALYARYQRRGLVILGFPTNDFGQQEPGSAQQIADFCYNTYGVQFPMFAKSSVKGPEQNPFYRAIQQASGKAPQWNFHKFLIDRNGTVVDHFYSMTEPQNPKIIRAIEKQL